MTQSPLLIDISPEGQMQSEDANTFVAGVSCESRPCGHAAMKPL